MSVLPSSPPTTANVIVSIAGAPVRGNSNAKLTVIEFIDYQCPICAWHFREALPGIERDFIATGKVKYVVRNFPLESAHPLAFKAAEAVLCAGDQHKFWEMHDRLLANQQALRPTDLPGHALSLGLDVPVFQQCLDSGKHADGIRSDIADGLKAGVAATPTFVVGLTDPNDPRITALRIIPGAQLYTGFKLDLESLAVSRK